MDKKLRSALSRNISSIDFSVRAQNCLANLGLETLKDLTEKTEQELLRTKNLGYKTLNEVKFVLDSLGLRLGMKFSKKLKLVSLVEEKPTPLQRYGSIRPKPIHMSFEEWMKELQDSDTRHRIKSFTASTIENCEKIVEVVKPFRGDPIELEFPHPDMLTKLPTTLRKMGLEIPVFTLSISERRAAVKSSIQNKIGVDEIFPLNSFWPYLTFRNFPRPLILSEDNFIDALVSIHYILKGTEAIWYTIHKDSFLNFKGGRLELPFSLEAVRCCVTEILDTLVTFLALGWMDYADAPAELAEFIRFGNVPFGPVRLISGNRKDVFLVLTA